MVVLVDVVVGVTVTIGAVDFFFSDDRRDTRGSSSSSSLNNGIAAKAGGLGCCFRARIDLVSPGTVEAIAALPVVVATDRPAATATAEQGEAASK